jgi:hypothetical protein
MGVRDWQRESEEADYLGARNRIRTESPSTAGMVFALTVAVCVSIALVMLTIKLGMVLFT